MSSRVWSIPVRQMASSPLLARALNATRSAFDVGADDSLQVRTEPRHPPRGR
jgi:beta-lactamase superfamily II metal-dependent hydrolase